jgi:hypothetical protein
MQKKWYTSKMVWFNALTVLVGVVGYLAGHEVIQSNATLLAGMVAGQGALNVVLRFLTWKPIK